MEDRHDQIDTFDRSEDIADALHSIAGLEECLLRELSPLLDRAERGTERRVLALIAAMAELRATAQAQAGMIAHAHPTTPQPTARMQ